jgi:hypothetical protein
MALKEVDRIISKVNGLNKKDRIVLFKKIDKLYPLQDKIMKEDDPLQAVFGLWHDYDIDLKMNW